MPFSCQSISALAIIAVGRSRASYRGCPEPPSDDVLEGRGARQSIAPFAMTNSCAAIAPLFRASVDSGRRCAVSVSACHGRSADHPQLNVVVITLDTTRADRLSPYGYMDASMPALERLAREGVVFDRAMTVAPLTLPAHTSMFTGLFPPHHGVRDNADRALVASGYTTLAETLRDSRIPHGSVRVVSGARIGSRARTGLRAVRGRAAER